MEWSRVTMWWGVAYGGLAFLFSPLVGRMSDAFGRRPTGAHRGELHVASRRNHFDAIKATPPPFAQMCNCCQIYCGSQS